LCPAVERVLLRAGGAASPSPDRDVNVRAASPTIVTASTAASATVDVTAATACFQGVPPDSAVASPLRSGSPDATVSRSDGAVWLMSCSSICPPAA
jgi:hypothetical protein